MRCEQPPYLLRVACLLLVVIGMCLGFAPSVLHRLRFLTIWSAWAHVLTVPKRLPAPVPVCHGQCMMVHRRPMHHGHAPSTHHGHALFTI